MKFMTPSTRPAKRAIRYQVHLFDQYLYPGADPTAATWMSTLPWWIIDWQYTDAHIQLLLEEYQRAAGPGPDRRDVNVEVPMGPENVLGTVPQPGVELSNLVIAESELNVPPETPEVTDVALTDQAWFEQMFPGQTYVPTVQPTSTGGEMLHENLFDDLGDLATDWARAQLGLGAPATSTPFVPSPASTGTMGPNVDTSGLYTAPGVLGGAATTGGVSPVWKKVCGVYKWVIPKRRRRRALLTESDYNALLRIEGLKVNKNMSIAIAKALTR